MILLYLNIDIYMIWALIASSSSLIQTISADSPNPVFFLSADLGLLKRTCSTDLELQLYVKVINGEEEPMTLSVKPRIPLK